MYDYAAKVLRVIDGDTLEVEIDLGFHVVLRERVRLYGINTPETHGPKAATERAAGEAAVAFVQTWLADHAPGGSPVMLVSHDAKQIGQEKYGRWLAVVKPNMPGAESLNAALLAAGHATKLEYR